MRPLVSVHSGMDFIYKNIGFIRKTKIQKCVQCMQKYANELETSLGNPWRRNGVVKLLRTILVCFFTVLMKGGADSAQIHVYAKFKPK